MRKGAYMQIGQERVCLSDAVIRMTPVAQPRSGTELPPTLMDKDPVLNDRLQRAIASGSQYVDKEGFGVLMDVSPFQPPAAFLLCDEVLFDDETGTPLAQGRPNKVPGAPQRRCGGSIDAR